MQALTRTRSRLAGELKANRMAAKDLPSDEGGGGGGGGGSEEERLILQEVTNRLAEQTKRLDALLGELLKRIMPEILEIRGVGVVLGATILAEVGDVSRFEKESRFARATAGRPPWSAPAARVAPVESGSTLGATEG